MISQVLWGIYHVHGKIQVKLDLKSVLFFFGGEILVNRETNQI